VRPGAEGSTDPVPEARPVAMSKELPGSSGVAKPVGGPRTGAGPKGRAVDRSLCGVRAPASINRPREHPWESTNLPSTRCAHCE
jgi:hypothetical protein